MNRSRLALFSSLLGVAVVGATTTAEAQVKRSTQTDSGYIEEFFDDPLHSGVDVPGGGRIIVRPVAHRVRLLRPRTSFVIEMIKSVESI